MKADSVVAFTKPFRKVFIRFYINLLGIKSDTDALNGIRFILSSTQNKHLTV